MDYYNKDIAPRAADEDARGLIWYWRGAHWLKCSRSCFVQGPCWAPGHREKPVDVVRGAND